MNIPKLYIRYAFPLDSDRRNHFEKNNLGYYPTIKEVKDKTSELIALWSEINKDDRVIKLLMKLTKIALPRDLELCVFGGGLPAMSFPLILSISRNNEISTNDKLIITLVHEICHRFAGDQTINPGVKSYWDNIRNEYPSENVSTQNHIIIYALLEEIVIELFGKERLKEVMRSTNTSYQKAILIASDKGAKKLIEQFQSYIKS